MGPLRGFCADGVLCSVWSSSVMTHLLHCSCFDLYFISVEHPAALLLEPVGFEPQVCPFQALQLLPEHKKQRQMRKCLETPLPTAPMLGGSSGCSHGCPPCQPKAAAWPWPCLTITRLGFLTSPAASYRICGSLPWELNMGLTLLWVFCCGLKLLYVNM